MTNRKNEISMAAFQPPRRDGRKLTIARPAQIMTPEEKSARVRELAEAAVAPNTRRTYSSDVQHYLDTGRHLPASEHELTDYMVEFENVLAPVTIAHHLAALSKWHVQMNFRDPTGSATVKATLAGINRSSTHVPNIAAPLTDSLLVELVERLRQIRSEKQSGNARDKAQAMIALRDSALLQLGFFGAFRRSELVGIQLEQITWEAGGIRVRIQRSKTDQVGIGLVRTIPRGNELLCAVSALREWLDAAGITDGPIFRPLTKSGNVRDQALTDRSVANIIVDRLSEIGVDNAKDFSGHSLRRGFTTSAHYAGATLEQLKKQGGWKRNDTVSTYVAEAEQFGLNAGALVLKGIGDTKK